MSCRGASKQPPKGYLLDTSGPVSQKETMPSHDTSCVLQYSLTTHNSTTTLRLALGQRERANLTTSLQKHCLEILNLFGERTS